MILSSCGGPLSTLDPAGPSAGSIATLFHVMFWGSVALFALVTGILALCFIAPGFASRLSSRWLVFGGGLVMPSVILTALVIFALFMGERLIASPQREAPLRVEAHAAQWNWTFRYPAVDGVAPTMDRLHIPSGEPVDIVITSADVIHSFWVPRLGGKLDAIPGHENIVRLQADRPGIYRGVCAEFCGEGHTIMEFTVEAHAPQDYESELRQMDRTQ
ncbi:cytochrome c oxidase subunit II [Rhizobium sp. CFBP 8762]|uniref:cytochrome c oxidase subunit II n=1 Tax=Rhizobium sp. CFBP 8762 TaxID=2775279 RepID=UPI001FD5FBE9|nr:cytochrome c oxidase subunit II [Rhizobium sp. CFBP 8762]